MKPKKRITTWSYGAHSFPVDADEDWERFQADPFDQQVESVASSFFWQIHLPWIDLPPVALQRFWEDFSLPGKEEVRTAAVHGIKYANNFEALDLLNTAIQFQRDLTDGRFKGTGNSERFRDGAILLGLRFAALAGKKDHRPLRQLADIMKAGGIDGGCRGGEDDFHGQVIRDFCQLVAGSRCLPTKKELRESLGLSTEKTETERFRTALNALGLGGLPQGRKC